MHIPTIAKTAEKFITDNSPAILTAIGIVGTVGTAYLTGKAVLKAHKLIEADKEVLVDGKPIEIDLKEKFLLTWTYFIPPVATCTITVTSIFFANRIGTRRAAAIAAAYTLSDKAFQEYRDKVKETLGKNKEQKVRDEIVQKTVENDPPTKSNTVVVDKNGTQLFREFYSGRYFHTTVEHIRHCQNVINQDINLSGYASLSDFYVLLGMEVSEVGNQLGWNQELLDVDLSSAGQYNGVPYIHINYYTKPKPDWDRFGS